MLFAAYGGGHVTMLEPVARAVSAAGYRIGFLGLTTAQAYLEAAGLDYFGFAELTGAGNPEVQAWGRELAGPLVPGAPVSHHESIAYHGLNFRDLVEEVGESTARRHYQEHARQGFLPVATMSRLLQDLSPRLVVSTNSPRSERALFIAAKALAIPALCLVDMFAMQEFQWIGSKDYADTICVLNEDVRSFLIERGCNPQNVVCTGNPAFDTIGSLNKRQSGAALRQAKGFASGQKVILWASNVEPERHPFTGAPGSPDLPQHVEAELRRLVKQHVDWHLLVRYHPSQNVQFLPGERVEQSLRGEDLHSLLHAVDLVVVMSSTVGLEAYFAGRPVVSVDMSIFTAEAPYSKMGVSTGVAALNELENAIIIGLSKGQDKGFDRAVTNNATAAVYDQILALLDRHAADE